MPSADFVVVVVVVEFNFLDRTLLFGLEFVRTSFSGCVSVFFVWEFVSILVDNEFGFLEFYMKFFAQVGQTIIIIIKLESFLNLKKWA